MDAPRILALTPLQHQQLGGMIMRIGESLIFGLMAVAGFLQRMRADLAEAEEKMAS